jgi:hypothetical protein
MRRPALCLLPLLIAALIAGGCDDDKSKPQQQPVNNAAPVDAGDGEDASEGEDAADDAPEAEDVPEDTGPRPEPGTRVEIDLTPHLGPGPNPAGAVRVFESAAQEDLVPGEALLGRVGDWVMENERVRFVIERDERVIGPCPYGGNIIDAATREGGEFTGQDVIGEVCMLMNAGADAEAGAL